MKAAIFSTVPYQGRVEYNGWPVPNAAFSPQTAEESMNRALDTFELADQLGFDWVTVAEHHYGPASMTPNPMVFAAALTQRVKTAKIALLGSNIPIQNPVRVAEEFAMLDAMTGGRIVAGIFRGTSNEYVTYGINPAESRERFQEALKLVVKAWTEPQPFGWQGRFYEYRTISIWPKPVQQPHPPIFMSASSPEAAEFAAKNRIGAGYAVTTVPLAKEAVQLYRAAAAEEGWEPGPDDILYRPFIYVAETDEQAYQDLENVPALQRPLGAFSAANLAVDDAAAQSGYYGRDTEHQRARVLMSVGVRERIETGTLLAGSPETVLKQVQWVHEELGTGILDLVFVAPDHDAARRSIELFGTQVLPRMREI
jgi:alkanesulfonate monooxygenase SsuD/methylene tetrahydromethanopterin reductase-like flavin-dependent oxidoreductase (luciferase family)